MKQKQTVRLTNAYKVWKDNRVLASFALIVYGVLQLAAFVPVPVISLVYAFTVGMLVGNCFGVLILTFLFVFTAKNLISNKVFQKVVTRGRTPYLLGVGATLFLVSFAYYFTHMNLGWTHFNRTPFKAASNWYDHFNPRAAWLWSRKHSTFWFATNGPYTGALGAVLFALVTSLLTPAGSLLVLLLLVALTVLVTCRAISKKGVLTAHVGGGLTLKQGAKTPETAPESNALAETLPFVEPNTIQFEKTTGYTPVVVTPPMTTTSSLAQSQTKTTTKEQAEKLDQLFATFGLDAKVVNTVVGPTVTKFFVKPAPSVNLRRFDALQKNIMLVLATRKLRLEVPIPGKSLIGIEAVNKTRVPVSFASVFNSVNKKFSPLTVGLGQNIEGQTVLLQVNKTPHLLIAGATGSGKSAAINTIVASIIMRSSPDVVRFVLVDPKCVEFTVFEGIPHLLTPVITKPIKAAKVLKTIVRIMDERYRVMAAQKQRKISEYNVWAKRNNKKPWPYIVVVVDELADLMATAPRDVEQSIQRLAQKARAAGIHLILATQRPSTNVITGVIKANIPSRMAFAVSATIDSKVILDTGGAEKLTGRGDMLLALFGRTPVRVQTAYLKATELQQYVGLVKQNGTPNYDPVFDDLLDQDAGQETGTRG